MPTRTINIHEIDVSLDQILEQVRAGIDIVLTDNQGPAVRLVPVIEQPQQRIPDLHKGAIKMTEDFNDPLHLI